MSDQICATGAATTVADLPVSSIPERCNQLEPAFSSQCDSPSSWWRIADLGVFGIWIAIVCFTLQYHEKWADEAQAWLLVRDLDLKTLWLHESRYEGTPGLWHTILWVAQHIFHAKYSAIGPIGVVCAAGGVALLIFLAPFPRFIRWPLAFTYVMVYQYAVIARPYTVLTLLAFATAALFKDLKHPERMTAVLILLANTSFHGTLLAGCFGLAYLIDAVKSWQTLEARVRNRYFVCIGLMVVTFIFLFLILKPTPDVEEFALKKELAQLPLAVQAQQPTKLVKLTTVLSGAFLDWLVPSVAFVLLAGAWCAMRRRLITFALPVAFMIALYTLIHGYAHHHGTVFIAAITGLWIAWPTHTECAAFGVTQRRAYQGMVLLLLCLCAVNIWDAEGAIVHEYLYPYSGAKDAANYLKSVGADRGPIFGLLYGVVGVQAYFDHNIFSNIPTSYFHHGLPLYGTTLNESELEHVNPEYIVVFTEQPQLMADTGLPPLLAEGYQVVHFSDGYMLYKRGVYVRQVYFILRRVGPTAGRIP